MDDSSRRKNIEKILQSTIRQAQASVQSDPQLKKMVEQLRNLYQEDREDFLFALGAAPPPSASKKPIKVPPSRIPQLLYILNAVTSRGAISVPPPFRKQPGGLPASLQNATLEVIPLPEDGILPRHTRPPSPARRPSQLKELEEIGRLDSQIDEAQRLFEEIKKEESAIRQRKGKYAIAIERLKAERLLRELPGTIARLVHKKRLLEEQVHAPNTKPGDES